MAEHFMKMHKLLPLLALLILAMVTLWLIGYAPIEWLEDDYWYQKATEYRDAVATDPEQAKSCWWVPVHQLYILQGLIIALVAAWISYGLLLFAKRSVAWSLAIFVMVFGIYWLYEKSQFCLNWSALL